jgi:acetylornithine deacetylase
MDVKIFDVHPERPDVVGVWRGKGKGHSLILNGHIDVAEVPEPDQWRHPPFEPVVEEGRIYGRGASDMKGGLAGFLMTLTALHDLGAELKGDVIFQCVAGEETGEPGTRLMADRGYRADFAIVGECARACDIFIAGVGVLNAAIAVRSPTTFHLANRLGFARAGGKLEGANAIDKMVQVIIPALMALDHHWSIHKLHPLLPPGQAMINVFGIEGGGNPFIIPNNCRCYFTAMYLADENPEAVQKEVEDHVSRAIQADPWLRQYEPEIEWTPRQCPIQFLAFDTPSDHPGVEALAEAITKVRGVEPRRLGRGAIVDAGWLDKAGIPSVVYGPGDVKQAHSVDEMVEEKNLVDFTESLALFVANWCG